MKIQKAVITGVSMVLCLLSAKTAFATDVKTDYDRAADFGHYKTFCWQGVKTSNPLWIQRIKTAVGAALAAKGWTSVQPGSGCDVAVMAMEIEQDHDTLNTFYDDFGGGGGGWGWRGFGGDGFGEATTTTSTYTTGTLVVDLFDMGGKNLIWRGSATDTLSDKSDKNIKTLNNSVNKLFDHFPPQPKS